jgi:hypothetical protein
VGDRKFYKIINLILNIRGHLGKLFRDITIICIFFKLFMILSSLEPTYFQVKVKLLKRSLILPIFEVSNTPKNIKVGMLIAQILIKYEIMNLIISIILKFCGGSNFGTRILRVQIIHIPNF